MLTTNDGALHGFGAFAYSFGLRCRIGGRITAFARCGDGGRCGPEGIIGHTLSIGIGTEQHSGPSTVVGRVLDEIVCGIGIGAEFRHVDLQAGGSDVVVVLIDPGAVRFVVIIVDDDIGIPPIITAYFPHIAQPTALLTIRPRLRDIRDTNRVIKRVDLDISWLFAGTVSLINGDVLKGPFADVAIAGTSTDEDLEIVVDFDGADVAAGVGEVGTVGAETDADCGAIGGVGAFGGRHALAELDDPDDGGDEADNFDGAGDGGCCHGWGGVGWWDGFVVGECRMGKGFKLEDGREILGFRGFLFLVPVGC